MIKRENDTPYRQCTVTVMDNIADPDIHFDKDGICNYYYDYQRAAAEGVLEGEKGETALAALAERIKSEGKGK